MLTARKHHNIGFTVPFPSTTCIVSFLTNFRIMFLFLF